VARLARLFVPGAAQHVLQRCASGRRLGLDDADFAMLLRCLTDATRQGSIALHAFVLMPDHLHLLASPAGQEQVPRLMQALGRSYVRYLNERHGTTGGLWAGRYRATVLEDDPYVLLCSRYIESNPVRAGLVDEPAHYRWSSYRHHIGLETQPCINDHPLYWALGNTPFERQGRYRALFEQPIPAAQQDALRAATWQGWALGSDAFLSKLAKSANRRPTALPRGRPARRLPQSLL
jgi:putative transposase